MKSLSVILTFFMLFGTAASLAIPAQASAPNEVRLTAADVQTAQDIEAAIHTATAWGSRPGTVILDGSLGSFVYTIAEANDYTINIFYSNLTLRGVNEAVFTNADGIFFDDVLVDHVVITGFKMHCQADCIVSWGMHQDVSIRNMVLDAPGIGIQVAQTSGWKINQNRIKAGWVAVHLLDASNIVINQNWLEAETPVMLQNTTDCKVKSNKITGDWQGVLLTTDSSSNQVINNIIQDVQSAGVTLESGTYDNKIIRNTVTCSPNYVCLTVDASGEIAENNKIHANYP